MNRAPPFPSAMTDTRLLLRMTMAQTAADERLDGNATYAPVRPSYVPTMTRLYPRGIKWRADCSSGARDVCWWTPGAPDPFQNGWQPWGNSSTIWARLDHEDDWSKAEVGDFFTFGYRYGEAHVAMVYDTTDPKNPKLWNFGRQGEPIITDLESEIAFHRGMEVTLCKARIVDPPATPQEILREMTGFYAWLTWRLGEGKFRHYGKRVKAVRPRVPLVIPAAWWAREKRFLLNRKRPNKVVAAPK